MMTIRPDEVEIDNEDVFFQQQQINQEDNDGLYTEPDQEASDVE